LSSPALRLTPPPKDRPASENARLHARVTELEALVRKGNERRRALLHIMQDLYETNRRLARQRKAMLHILSDNEEDRKELALQAKRLHESRRAVLHILTDMKHSNVRLEDTRKAMIHIMEDLRKTTDDVQRREQELREKQEQLVQAAKLATLGELTTGVAHELNNPLNNIGLYVGNAVDLLRWETSQSDAAIAELEKAEQQVRKASEIILHLRTFGRIAAVTREIVSIPETLERALALMQEQLRLRQIGVRCPRLDRDAFVRGNAIQIEQVFLNLLTNARDALVRSELKEIGVSIAVVGPTVEILVEDTGSGIPPGLEKRVFDPFFTTKEVGKGTGLGLSITYGIIKEHEGTIVVSQRPGGGTVFRIELPLAHPAPEEIAP